MYIDQKLTENQMHGESEMFQAGLAHVASWDLDV